MRTRTIVKVAKGFTVKTGIKAGIGAAGFIFSSF
jgi:hypothetical protein